MARKANPTLIGAFVLGAVALAVAGLVVLGGGKFFRQSQRWVVYFDESIKGLAIGAPVMLKGVKVGAVTDIKVVVDRKREVSTIPVFFEIEAERFTDASGKDFTFLKQAAGTKALIAQGLRAQLELQSLVTGQLAIQLDFHPDSPVRLVAADSGQNEMPAIPSSGERISKALDNLPLDQIAASALSAIQGIERVVNSADLKQALAALPATIGSVQDVVRRVGLNVDGALADVGKLVREVDGRIGPLASGIDTTLGATRDTIREVQVMVRRLDGEVVPAVKDTLQDTRSLVRNVDGRIGPLVASLEKTLATAGTALEEARRVLSTVDDTVADGSPLQSELLIALRDLSAAARSLRTLTDYVETHPESLVFGKNSSGGR